MFTAIIAVAIQPECNFVSSIVSTSQMTELLKGQKTKVFQNCPIPQREVKKNNFCYEFCYITLPHMFMIHCRFKFPVLVVVKVDCS